jgi:hypothetical protein
MAPPPLSHRTPVVVPAGPAADFSWAEFDSWQAAFAAMKVFPPRWEGLERAPAAHTPEADAYHLRKLALFDEWLDLLAGRPAVLAHYARHRVRARVARQDERAPCPACEPFNACEVGPGFEAMPPFHPGCRCVLVAQPRPSRARGRSVPARSLTSSQRRIAR